MKQLKTVPLFLDQLPCKYLCHLFTSKLADIAKWQLFLIYCNCNPVTTMILTTVQVKAIFKMYVSYFFSLNRIMHWSCSKENFSWLNTHFTPLLSTQNRSLITVELFCCWKYELCHLKRYNLVMQCMKYYLDWVTYQSSLSLKQISCSGYFRKCKREKTQNNRKLSVCTLWFLPEMEWDSILTNLQVNLSLFLDCSLNCNFRC